MQPGLPQTPTCFRLRLQSAAVTDVPHHTQFWESFSRPHYVTLALKFHVSDPYPDTPKHLALKSLTFELGQEYEQIQKFIAGGMLAKELGGKAVAWG